MTQPVEIIPTVGHVHQVTPPEHHRSTADHFALIRGVLRRQANRATAEHLYRQGSFAAVEELEAALASLHHLEQEAQSDD